MKAMSRDGEMIASLQGSVSHWKQWFDEVAAVVGGYRETSCVLDRLKELKSERDALAKSCVELEDIVRVFLTNHQAFSKEVRDEWEAMCKRARKAAKIPEPKLRP